MYRDATQVSAVELDGISLLDGCASEGAPAGPLRQAFGAATTGGSGRRIHKEKQPMRNALKLLLVAVAAVAALAFTAAPASAVEITEEGSGHCADVSIDGHDVVGGCRLAATSVGTVELRSLFGTMVNCNNQYEAAVDENGNGYLYNQSLTGTGCSVTPCTAEGEVTPWAINVTGTDPNYVMEADFCVVSSILGTINCHLTNVSVDPDGHDLANFAVNNGSGSHQFCEGSAINAVLGNWTAVSDASHPGLEISD